MVVFYSKFNYNLYLSESSFFYFDFLYYITKSDLWIDLIIHKVNTSSNSFTMNTINDIFKNEISIWNKYLK